MHEATEYATRVVYGDLVTCKWEKLSCKRHLDDLEKSKEDDYLYCFDESRANRIIEWFKVCRHVRGPFAGKPILLEDWQIFDLSMIFGWVEKKTGKRRFRTAYIRIARGHAKSTIMSGIVNYGMCGDVLYKPGEEHLGKFEYNPEIICGASDRTQANIVWGDARDMGDISPAINKRLKILRNSISHKTRQGKVVKLSKDSKNKDGGSPCIIVIDKVFVA